MVNFKITMKTLSITFIALLTVFTISSCKKSGCTNELATNFDSEATADDGTCQYGSNIVFWCLPAVSDSLRNLGHTQLKFDIDNEIVDSIVTEFFFSSVGECNASGTKTISREFFGDTKQHYHYRVRGNNGQVIYEDFIQIKAKDCFDVRLL